MLRVLRMHVRCCRALKQTVKMELCTGESLIRADSRRQMFELLASSKHRALLLQDDDMVGLMDQSIQLFDGMQQQGDVESHCSHDHSSLCTS